MVSGSLTRSLLIAVGSVLAAVTIRLAIEPSLEGTVAWLTFYPAVFTAALFGGWRAGVTAVVLSTVVVWAWYVPSWVLPYTRALIGSLVFSACGIAFAYIAEMARRSRAEEHRLRTAAEASRAEALEANRAKDQFLAMLGHELRNPLAPIATATTLLRSRLEHSKELDIIERQVKHMSRLVDDLLDVSRIVRGQLQLHRSSNDLSALVRTATEMVAPKREGNGDRFVVDVPTGIYVDVDAARIVQVITNVLVNATKFSAPHEPVHITGRRDGERAVLTIRDRGVGMEPALLARAFEPFVQGAQEIDRSAGGLGLGLAIARKLAEQHDGTLQAVSEIGKGTEVELTLPTTAERPSSSNITTVPPTGGQRILVVDDNQDGAQMLAELLEARGHEVRIAYDGPAALESLATFTPTLALVDIGLPVMDGHELVREMRARGVKAPVVALTGYGQSSDRERSLDAGFDDHLVKPVSLSHLDEVIRQLAA